MAVLKLFRFAAAGLVAVLLALAWTGHITGGEAASPPGSSETKEISPALRNPENAASLLKGGASSLRTLEATEAAADEAAIGDQADWVALSDTGSFYYLKTFELRASDDVGEVWIAVGEGAEPVNGDGDGIFGLNFPDGDCRNDGVRNVVTDEQAQYLLDQYTNKIKATDEDWFGPPTARFGEDALLPIPSPAGKQVILVDNVRDDNFYDTNNSQSLPYIAGFFTSAMIDFHDRNVMSIDGFDWLHRTTGDPPHAPSSDPCTNAPARPFLYEGVFAHEYQHLIHNDYDADEVNWVNEGMSDLAIFLNGYGNPGLHIDKEGNDSHVMSFQGWNSVAHPDWNPIPRPSGPENSLTQWGDQGDVEILEDYGIAYTFMQYLYDHGYGKAFFRAWHHNPLNGIEGLDDQLHKAHAHTTFAKLFDDFKVMTLVDAFIDKGADVKGGSRRALQSRSLNSTIYFSPEAYSTPGAPPWGSDYIPLGSGNRLRSLKFDGAEQVTFPGGNDWTIDADGYWTTPDETGGTTYAPSTDSSISHEVTVPDGTSTLTFEHWYQTEATWDFAFVQVLADDQFVSIPCTNTTEEHDPGADPAIAENVPGFTGPTQDPNDPATAGTPAAPLTESCDLSAFAGQTVVVAFRFMSDTAVQFDGWHIRNVAVNGTPVDTTPEDISDWDNEQFFLPVDLGFDLTLVGLDGTVDQFGYVHHVDDVVVVHAHLRRGSTYTLSNHDKNALKHSDQVVAIVTGVPADEGVSVYFPYSLKVNRVEMADGAGLP